MTNTTSRELGFDTIARQTYSAEQIDAVDTFVAEHGDDYDTITDVLADMRSLGYGV